MSVYHSALCRRWIRRRSERCWTFAAACERVSLRFAWSVDGLVLVGPTDTLVNDWINLAVLWSGLGSVDATIVARGGQWRINKEEEKNNNDERSGRGDSSISVNFCSCVCVCVRVVWLVAVVAVITAHPCWRRFLFFVIARCRSICAVQA